MMKTYFELFGTLAAPVLITTQQNIFYTVGFSTTARRPTQIGYNCVLMTPESTWFLFPSAWFPLVQEQELAGNTNLIPYQGSVIQLVQKIVEIVGCTDCLGFEQDGMELNLYLLLKTEFEKRCALLQWIDISSAVQKARLIKTKEEIEALRISASVAKSAMEYAKTILRPGVKECDIVAKLEYHMRKNGSEGVPFTMKVLTGQNGLRTMNLPGNNIIQRGDIVLLDFGAVVQHYASDWTRSFAIGTASKEQTELYQLVWEIEQSCIGLIRPGICLQDLMDQAMKIIYGHPYAKWFNPYLGHSIGINSQEWPAIIPGAEELLEENMVITIEPGIYVPGVGGVRIEDEVLVTENGRQVLTGLDQEEFLLLCEE